MDGRRSNKAFVTFTLVFATLTIVFACWISFCLGGDRLTDAVDDIGEGVASLLASGACA